MVYIYLFIINNTRPEMTKQNGIVFYYSINNMEKLKSKIRVTVYT